MTLVLESSVKPELTFSKAEQVILIAGNIAISGPTKTTLLDIYLVIFHGVGMEHLKPAQFENLLSLAEKALVLFYADWCPFCQRFIPIFQSAVTKSKFTIGYKTYGAKLNEDSNPLWDKFSISAVPTIIAFERGSTVSRRDAKMGIGLTKPDIDSLLDDLDWR